MFAIVVVGATLKEINPIGAVVIVVVVRPVVRSARNVVVGRDGRNVGGRLLRHAVFAQSAVTASHRFAKSGMESVFQPFFNHVLIFAVAVRQALLEVLDIPVCTSVTVLIGPRVWRTGFVCGIHGENDGIYPVLWCDSIMNDGTVIGTASAKK